MNQETIKILINAGKKVGALSILKGTWNKDFQLEVETHVKRMLSTRIQSHFGFNRRIKNLESKGYKCEFAEICSESWPGQDELEAATDAFEVSWPRSKGHWEVVMKPCTYYGISMGLGRNRIYYVCMLVGCCKKEPEPLKPDIDYILW